MFTVQLIEWPASLQVQSTKSILVKFSIFLHKFGGAAVAYLQDGTNNRLVVRSDRTCGSGWGRGAAASGTWRAHRSAHQGRQAWRQSGAAEPSRRGKGQLQSLETIQEIIEKLFGPFRDLPFRMRSTCKLAGPHGGSPSAPTQRDVFVLYLQWALLFPAFAETTRRLQRWDSDPAQVAPLAAFVAADPRCRR
jgi:hypothetical protein